MLQGVPLPFFLFQKLITQRPKQLHQKFQQFLAFHEVPFYMSKFFFMKNFEKMTLVTKIDQRGRHPSRYHTWSKLLTFCVFRPLEQVVFEHNYCFWIILSIRWTYFLTTVHSIAQNLIWSNDIFLTNCVKTAYFLISQCPYTLEWH